MQGTISKLYQICRATLRNSRSTLKNIISEKFQNLMSNTEKKQEYFAKKP